MRRALLLSDLHLGPALPGESFREEVALAALLDHWAGEGRPTELVLAGDIFDFLWSPGYDGWSAAKAPERFAEILRNPRVRAVLAGLRRFAERPGHEVTLLAGNHDPEVLLPTVREMFEEAIGRRGSVLYPDDTPLAPAGDRPAVFGRTLGPPEAPVWVVHGDRWDTANFIDRAAFSEEAGTSGTATLPPGSHLVFEVLARLKPRFPWIDLLKPEMPAVLLLLLYLDPEVAEGFLKRHLGLTSGLLRDMIRARLRLGPQLGPAPAAAEPEAPGDVLVESLAASLAEEPGGRRELFLAELQRRLAGGAAAGGGTLAEHGGLLRWVARSLLAEARKRDRFLELDGPDATLAAAAPVLPENLAALVVGHTHAPRLAPGAAPAYVNLGTWLPVVQLPREELEGWIDRLEVSPPAPTATPRTFAEVDLGGGVPRVRLMASDETGHLRELQR